MSYQENGYLHLTNFLPVADLESLREHLVSYFERWKDANRTFYRERAVNAAYLTSLEVMDKAGRQFLFELITDAKLVDIAEACLGEAPAFMNTQLFFNPYNTTQRNYWHRDGQYHLSLPEQQKALHQSDVLHFRLPVFDEPGIELVPGSHRQWDSEEQLDIRLAKNGKTVSDPMQEGREVALAAGDLLVFSANMLHRGIYGGERLALDIIYCPQQRALLKYVDVKCLPNTSELRALNTPQVFERTLACIDKA